MNGLHECFNRLSSLTSEAKEHLFQVTQVKTFKKGATLLRQGQVAKCLYYIDEGLVKLSFTANGKEFIMRFFPEGSLSTGLDSFLTQTSSGYALVALEQTTVHYITYHDLEVLCKGYHCVETAFSKFLSTASVNMMARVSEMLEEEGTRRYENFVERNGPLMQRISLGDLAGYLGIAQVSLSRIRAKK